MSGVAANEIETHTATERSPQRLDVLTRGRSLSLRLETREHSSQFRTKKEELRLWKPRKQPPGRKSRYSVEMALSLCVSLPETGVRSLFSLVLSGTRRRPAKRVKRISGNDEERGLGSRREKEATGEQATAPQCSPVGRQTQRETGETGKTDRNEERRAISRRIRENRKGPWTLPFGMHSIEPPTRRVRVFRRLLSRDSRVPFAERNLQRFAFPACRSGTAPCLPTYTRLCGSSHSAAHLNPWHANTETRFFLEVLLHREETRLRHLFVSDPKRLRETPVLPPTLRASLSARARSRSVLLEALGGA